MLECPILGTPRSRTKLYDAGTSNYSAQASPHTAQRCYRTLHSRYLSTCPSALLFAPICHIMGTSSSPSSPLPVVVLGLIVLLLACILPSGTAQVWSNTSVVYITAGLRSASDVHVDAFGYVYVADDSTAQPQVLKFDHLGNPIANFSNTNPSLIFPSGVALDLAGNMYITDYTRHVIYKLSPDGAQLAVFNTTACPTAGNAIVDSAGYIYFSAAQDDLVCKLSSDGTLNAVFNFTTFAFEGIQPALYPPSPLLLSSTSYPQMLFDTSVAVTAVDAQGNIYVGNSNQNRGIVKLSPTGVPLLRFPTVPLTISPRGITVTPNGLVVVADGHANRLVIYSADASSSTIINVQLAGHTELDGCAVDSSSYSIYVAAGSQVLEFVASGVPSSTGGGAGGDSAGSAALSSSSSSSLSSSSSSSSSSPAAKSSGSTGSPTTGGAQANIVWSGSVAATVMVMTALMVVF